MWEKYKHIIPHIAVGSGVIETVPEWILSNGYKSVMTVCDLTTYDVAGKRVIEMLKNAGIAVRECMLNEYEPLPNENTIGIVTTEFSREIDLILGIGSGTINDICTFVGEKVSCPSAIVATAPSMDGYAAIGSAILSHGVKITPLSQCATAIFCDVDILAAAPMHLIAAGLGDMLGKITALADWRLSHILMGEPLPEDIVNIVTSALDKIIAGAPHVFERDPNVIQSITEGLLLTGIAISLYGDSRPASGCEHHLSHFWEMRTLAQGRKPALHGTKVGIATVAVLAMWKEFLKTADTVPNKIPYIDEKYEENIRRLYGRSAETILGTENPNLSLSHLQENWCEIIKIAESLPEPEFVADILKNAEAPLRLSEILLDERSLKDSVIYSRDRKKLYTLLQLFGDLGKLDYFADFAGEYFTRNALTGVKCLVLDMDGTIYLGDKIFPYTLSVLEKLRELGMDYIFYTNNSSQNSANYLEKLGRMGIDVSPDKLLMSTHVLLDYLKAKQAHMSSTNKVSKAFVCGTKALLDDFANAGYVLVDENPDFVVLGFDKDMDYERLTKLCDFVRDGLPYYGVHMDYNCPIEGGYIPDCGSLAAAAQASTGVTPEFFGKPSLYTLEYIIKKTGYSVSELCFVGDRLYTDIAVTTGTKARSVLVLSGETKRGDLENSAFVPDVIAEDLTKFVVCLT
ncbi:MAG: iron-containing alcohol dehydrogenase [Oscillospiraceae bacterium]|nr:iron-containing alcohol dehydrogenase [Oscillospiraceae bacterium]